MWECETVFSLQALLGNGKQTNGVLDNEAQRALIVANALSRHGPTHGNIKLSKAEWICQNYSSRSFIVSLDREVTYLSRITPPLSQQEIWAIVYAPHRFSSAALESQPEFDTCTMYNLLEQRFGSMVEETDHYRYEDDGKSLEAAPISLRVAVRAALSLNGSLWNHEEPLDSWRDLKYESNTDSNYIICTLYAIAGCQLYDVNLPVGNGNSSHYLIEVMPEVEAGLHAVYVVGHGWDGDLWQFGMTPNPQLCNCIQLH